MQPCVTPRRSQQIVAGLNEWLKLGDEPRELGLLPFSIEEALLPGETKEVHLYEARFLKLFTDATQKQAGCLGQLLITPGGNAAAISPLLVVDESRRRDVGVWARLKCVARVRLVEIQGTDYDFAQAIAELIFDAYEGSAWTQEERCAEGDESIDLEAQIYSVYESCFNMQQKLKAKNSANATGAKDGEDMDIVEWGHEVREEQSIIAESLAHILSRHREVLCSKGPDAPPEDSLMAAVKSGWNVTDSDEAERQLLSFAVFSLLSPAQRAQALAVRSTQERLQAGLARLLDQQKRLAAMCALIGLEVS